MATFDIIVQETLRVLSSPAWSGAWTASGVIMSSALTIIALRNTRQPQQIPVRPQKNN